MDRKNMIAPGIKVIICLAFPLIANTLAMEPDTVSAITPLDKQLDKQRIEAKLREQGIPTNLKTTNGLKERIEHQKGLEPVTKQLLDRYEVLHKKAISDYNNTPLSEHSRHVLTPDLIKFIPVGIINEQFFNPSDTFFDTAIKLERLGLAIKDLNSELLMHEAQEKRHILMAHCFARAGDYVERAIKTLKQTPDMEIDLVTLADMYQTGGLFYHWAALNMPSHAKDIMDRRAEQLNDEGLKMIQVIYKLMGDLSVEKTDKNEDQFTVL